MICLYGYAFSCFIVIFLLCIIPVDALQWIFMVYGMLNTIAFMILNLMDYLDNLERFQQYVVYEIIGAVQIGLFLTFKLFVSLRRFIVLDPT